MSEPVRLRVDPDQVDRDHVHTSSARSVFWPEPAFHALIARRLLQAARTR